MLETQLVETAVHVDEFVRSDVGNGQLFVARHGRDLRYVHPWAKWLVWQGTHWAEDRVGDVERRMKETLRWLAATANEIADDETRKRLLRFAIDSEREPRVRAAITMARSESGVAVLPEQLDAKPWLLNTRNATVDLRDGQAVAHDRDDLLTMVAPVEYHEDATCPRWDQFVDEVIGDLGGFMQRVVGYTLTGSTREQLLIILHGAGANGKTTFLQTVMAMMGGYAQQAPPETFLERRDTIPNDIARLRGARLVAAAETGEGRSLNEALVKRMTGGERLTARFMRGEWFEFLPVFTPWLITNHRPRIRGTDEAIWRRIRLVPFDVTIPEQERDSSLAATLLDELPGILAWAVAGASDWYANGLPVPDRITQATAGYRADEDTLGAFITDRCLTDGTLWALAGDLYRSYREWAEQAGERPLTQQAFGRRLGDRGYDQARVASGRRWLGIALTSNNGNHAMTPNDAFLGDDG